MTERSAPAGRRASMNRKESRRVSGRRDSALPASGQSLFELQAVGNQFVIADNTALPFADGSVDTVITNSVPIDVDTWLAPGVQTSEVLRILAEDGIWINNGVVVPLP